MGSVVRHPMSRRVAVFRERLSVALERCFTFMCMMGCMGVIDDSQKCAGTQCRTVNIV